MAIPIQTSQNPIQDPVPIHVRESWREGYWIMVPIGEYIQPMKAKDWLDMLRLAALITKDNKICYMFRDGKHLRTMIAAKENLG